MFHGAEVVGPVVNLPLSGTRRADEESTGLRASCQNERARSYGQHVPDTVTDVANRELVELVLVAHRAFSIEILLATTADANAATLSGFFLVTRTNVTNRPPPRQDCLFEHAPSLRRAKCLLHEHRLHFFSEPLR